MSRGQYNLTIPHSCGQEIEVTVKWQSWPATRTDPENYDEDWDHIEECPKCKAKLYEDSAFMLAVENETADYDGPWGDEEEPDMYDPGPEYEG